MGGEILNFQQAGLLVGGILWGILGDKRGRLSVLFGSIITYSLANVACGFVHDPQLYALLRFVAGLGLAGELGAGITLVSEILPPHLRGYGSSLVASVGLLGAVVAYFTVTLFDWRTTYFIGGGLGLGLLLLRVSVLESGMFKRVQQTGVSRGNFWALFRSRAATLRYLRCMGIAIPTYLVIGIFATFSNEFGKAVGITEPIQPGRAVMFTYIGTVAGDLFSGLLSQWLRSRRQAIGLMMSLTFVIVIFYLFGSFNSASTFYGICTGYGLRYWLHCHVPDHHGREFRYQPPRYGYHLRSQQRSGHYPVNHSGFSGHETYIGGAGIGRYRYGDLLRTRLLVVDNHGRNLWQRAGL